ncbi:MAG: hypothetical protein ACLRZG_08925 [Streptococcus sp.]
MGLKGVCNGKGYKVQNYQGSRGTFPRTEPLAEGSESGRLLKLPRMFYIQLFISILKKKEDVLYAVAEKPLTHLYHTCLEISHSKQNDKERLLQICQAYVDFGFERTIILWIIDFAPWRA